MRTILSVSLPENINGILNDLSKENDRSKSYIIQKAIEYYAKEHNNLNIAMSRLTDSDDKIISIAEMRAKLEI